MSPVWKTGRKERGMREERYFLYMLLQPKWVNNTDLTRPVENDSCSIRNTHRVEKIWPIDISAGYMCVTYISPTMLIQVKRPSPLAGIFNNHERTELLIQDKFQETSLTQSVPNKKTTQRCAYHFSLANLTDAHCHSGLSLIKRLERYQGITFTA